MIKLPKTRSEAKKLGVPYYFTGEPCTHGHIDKRRVHNSTCCTCERESRKAAVKKRRNEDPSFKRFLKIMERARRRNKHSLVKWRDNQKIMKVLEPLKEDSSLEVDHIVPITGKYKGEQVVCGLHNEFNLRLTSRAENMKTNFTQWPEMWDYNGWGRQKKKS